MIPRCEERKSYFLAPSLFIKNRGERTRLEIDRKAEKTETMAIVHVVYGSTYIGKIDVSNNLLAGEGRQIGG